MRSDDEWDEDGGSDDDDEGEEDEDEDEDDGKGFGEPPSGSKGPSVVVFNDTSVGRQEAPRSKADWKAFMSSEIKKVSGEVKRRKITREEAQQDAEDDQHDRELMDLLKTTKLVEQYTSSELTGADRRKYLEKKVVELGGMPEKRKAPLPMRIGMAKKEQERAAKRVQEAKDMGLYHSSLKTQILGSTGRAALDDKVSKKRQARTNRGIDGGFGTFKNGTLFVGQKDIAAVA
ncbi:hypothetical protein HK104_007989, partial [Borealophlyctis nickersoniae]